MFDVIIIGAGASGLFASVLLSRAGKKVLVIEQNARAGKKLSLCGGGSCNLGPVERESAELALRYTRYTRHPKTKKIRQEAVRDLKTLFYAYPPALVRSLWTRADAQDLPFRGLGIALREENGLLFPARHDARSLTAELCAMAERAGAEFRYSATVTGIAGTEETRYEVRTTEDGNGDKTLSTRFVIVASGGFAYPAVGGNSSGIALLSGLGIACREGYPAMGPLLIENYPFAASSGTVIPARVTVVSSDSGAELVRTGTDQLLFTHRGLSGPVILDICGAVHECESEKPALILDLAPGTKREELLALMQGLAREHPNRQAVQLLSGLFPRVLASTLLDKAGINPESLSAEVPKAAMMKAIDWVKMLSLRPLLPSSRSEAMSWSGGVACEEIDFTSMEAKKAPGLFITGDMVSFCRPCGGYSLWFCWTGALAAAIKIDSY